LKKVRVPQYGRLVAVHFLVPISFAHAELQRLDVKYAALSMQATWLILQAVPRQQAAQPPDSVANPHLSVVSQDHGDAARRRNFVSRC